MNPPRNTVLGQPLLGPPPLPPRPTTGVSTSPYSYEAGVGGEGQNVYNNTYGGYSSSPSSSTYGTSPRAYVGSDAGQAPSSSSPLPPLPTTTSKSPSPRTQAKNISRGGQESSGKFLYPEDEEFALHDGLPEHRMELLCSLFRTSKRSLIIYIQFLVVPFVITFGWIMIPDLDFWSWAVICGLYYLYSFLTWQVFFDLLLPGLGWYLAIAFNVIFAAGMIGWFALFKIGDIADNKLSYLLIGVWGLICNTLCYSIHVLRSHVFNQAPVWEPAPLPDHFVSGFGGVDRGLASPDHRQGGPVQPVSHSSASASPSHSPRAVPLASTSSSSSLSYGTRSSLASSASSHESVKLNVHQLSQYTAELERQAEEKRGPTFDKEQERYRREDVHCSRFFLQFILFYQICGLEPKAGVVDCGRPPRVVHSHVGICLSSCPLWRLAMASVSY
jgi:hypothetical protein